MPAAEADEYISRIEHEENVELCHAVLGRISPDQLSADAHQTYLEFNRWSQDRTRRFRNERVINRYQQREDRIANRLTNLRERGIITDEMLVLYGISGELPERSVYTAMTSEEKMALWNDRMGRRWGFSWRERFRNIPSWMAAEIGKPNWQKEGF